MKHWNKQTYLKTATCKPSVLLFCFYYHILFLDMELLVYLFLTTVWFQKNNQNYSSTNDWKFIFHIVGISNSLFFMIIFYISWKFKIYLSKKIQIILKDKLRLFYSINFIYDSLAD